MSQQQVRDTRGKFLIVGVSGHSLKELNERPDVIIWKSDKNTRTQKRVVPSSVQVIIATKTLSHDAFIQLRKEARRIKASFDFMSTGRIRETLAGFGV